MTRYVVAGCSVVGLVIATTTVVLTGGALEADAHCQVPCGIYDDAARIRHLREDATTIEKAVTNIKELAGKHDPQAFNQAARWVTTKEDHASHVIEVVSEYFLAQKVKPVAKGADGYDAYLARLADHHGVMVAAMTCKQSVDEGKVHDLDEAIGKLGKHYE